jgi:uncharacterized protein (TIGR00369 family)
VIVDEPVRGSFAYLEHPGILSLSGLEQMRRFQRKEYPYAPIWYLFGTDLVDVGIGTATWRLPASGWLQSAAGVIPGGVLAFAADAALGGAIYTTFEPGFVLATSDLAMNFLRPPASDCGAIIARGRLIQSGRSQALSEATVEDGHGRLLAHATSRCVITEVPGPLPDPPEKPIPWPEYRGPHPFQRPPEGGIVPQEVWDRMDGQEMHRAWQRGRLPEAPLSLLMGIRGEGSSDGAFSCAIPASPWFTTAGGTFYGGAVALLADHAIHGAVHGAVPSATSWGTLDLKVRFLRPVTPDERPLRATARVAHRGRRIVVASAEVVTADGKEAALADASVMLLPGRPWMPSRPAAPIDEAQEGDAEG